LRCLRSLHVGVAREQRRLGAEAQAFDLLALSRIERDGRDIVLAFVGAAGAGESGWRAGKRQYGNGEAAAEAEKIGQPNAPSLIHADANRPRSAQGTMDLTRRPETRFTMI